MSLKIDTVKLEKQLSTASTQGDIELKSEPDLNPVKQTQVHAKTAKVAPESILKVRMNARVEDQKDYARKVRLTFIFLFAMNFIRVFDNGILPAMIVTLKEDYGLDEIQLGYLGSLVFIGEVAGSLIAMPIF